VVGGWWLSSCVEVVVEKKQTESCRIRFASEQRFKREGLPALARGQCSYPLFILCWSSMPSQWLHKGELPNLAAQILSGRSRPHQILCRKTAQSNLTSYLILERIPKIPQHRPEPAKMDIRLLHPSDIPHVQQTNITNLPENYFCKYYMYHALSWPQLSYVAVDVWKKLS
jgi:hypothetical protein